LIDVRAEHIWKQYRLGTRRSADTFWALEDVSFEAERGSSLGIIGRNGAGKSTILKLLAGITAPTRGRIVIEGRLAALIEVGSGFHPELTGRENVFLSGAILGMRRREIAAKLDGIVEFAGVAKFIDSPVKWYSSGMYVRLGFAIAAHLQPDVLLVDEVLAAVERLCDSALLIETGRIAASGRPDSVVAEYHRRISIGQGAPLVTAHQGTAAIEITGLLLENPRGDSAIAFRTGEPLSLAVRYRAVAPVSGAVFEASYYSADGRTLIASTSTDELLIPTGEGTIEFACAAIPFPPGAYYVNVIARDRATGHVLHWWDGGTQLFIERGAPVVGQVHVPHTSRLVPDAERAPRLAAGARRRP
jgi:ABC-type polysaccharide/polyol phosphate transport system ATPase subunit